MVGVGVGRTGENMQEQESRPNVLISYKGNVAEVMEIQKIL